ncbi:MAG: hypothetical protein J6R16_03195 [Alistipes sp.]|nr:hypothetical protein [Alistipes sp.]
MPIEVAIYSSSNVLLGTATLIYGSHNNLILKEGLKLCDKNRFPTSKTTYEIVYR